MKIFIIFIKIMYIIFLTNQTIRIIVLIFALFTEKIFLKIDLIIYTILMYTLLTLMAIDYLIL